MFSSASFKTRLGASGFLLAALLISASPIYANAVVPTGTITGTVTCGDADAMPAAYSKVAVDGTTLSTQSTGSGRFTLSGVPAGPMLTVSALTPDDAAISSRLNVSLQPGETVDIGTLDLAACSQPGEAQLAVQADELPDAGMEH